MYYFHIHVIFFFNRVPKFGILLSLYVNEYICVGNCTMTRERGYKCKHKSTAEKGLFSCQLYTNGFQLRCKVQWVKKNRFSIICLTFQLKKNESHWLRC